MEKQFARYDRYEFINKIIGEGSEAMLREVFNDNELFDKLMAQDDEEFEEVMAKKLAVLTIDQMNELSKKYEWDIKVYDLNIKAK
jgi:hypothetical protein